MTFNVDGDAARKFAAAPLEDRRKVELLHSLRPPELAQPPPAALAGDHGRGRRHPGRRRGGWLRGRRCGWTGGETGETERRALQEASAGGGHRPVSA